MGMATDICIVGHVTRDVTRMADGTTVRQPGGTAFYAGVAAARLGIRTAVITRLATTDEAELLAELRETGAQVASMPSAATTTFENDYARAGRDDRCQWVRSRAQAMEPGDLAGGAPLAWLFGPLGRTDVGPDLVRRPPGATVALDLQGWLREVGPDDRVVTASPSAEALSTLRRVDVLKASETEARAVTGESAPGPMARALCALGPDEALVTLGDRGAVVGTPEETFLVHALPPDRVVDPTGCGDTFVAAYLVQRLAGGTPLESARLATAAASRVAEGRGPLRASLAELQPRAQQVRVEPLDRTP